MTKLILVFSVAFLLSSCALTITEEAADAFNQTLSELSDTADERELARHFQSLPTLRAA